MERDEEARKKELAVLEEEYKTGGKSTDFRRTKAYGLIREFLFRIDLSIKTEPQTDPEEPDPFLEKIEEIVSTTPLSQLPSRYANLGMKEVIYKICCLTDDKHLRHSFGNLVRMDFGTGHELNYLCYLYKRHISGHLKINEVTSVLKVYARIVRAYISKFNVEAAGARGWWSLDDYMLLPYLFGTSENAAADEDPFQIQQNSFPSGRLRRFDGDIQRRLLGIVSQRGGRWKDANVGLIKMYDEEVLGKHVVTQHFIYCKELPE